MDKNKQMREAPTNGAWCWVRYESLNGPIEAPAQYRADAEAFYSVEFSGVPAREVIVLRALTAPAVEVPDVREVRGSGDSDHFLANWTEGYDIGWNDCRQAMLDSATQGPAQHLSDCSSNNRGVPELLGPCDCAAMSSQSKEPT